LYGFERRKLFDSEAPAPAADLLADEIENLLPDMFARMAIEADGPVLVKVHDRARMTPGGEWLFPPERVRAVLYMVRHPFDVAVSWANHRNVTAAEAVENLCDEDYVIAGVRGRLPLPLAERPGSWNSNASSWLNNDHYPITLTRYEDLYTDPITGFARMAAAAGVRATPEEIARCVRSTRFERLAAEERRDGFRERPRSSASFFRSGKPHSWAGILGEGLRQRLASCCAPAMERLGYEKDGTFQSGPIIDFGIS
jgi:hypothetical protein